MKGHHSGHPRLWSSGSVPSSAPEAGPQGSGTHLSVHGEEPPSNSLICRQYIEATVCKGKDAEILHLKAVGDEKLEV